MVEEIYVYDVESGINEQRTMTHAEIISDKTNREYFEALELEKQIADAERAKNKEIILNKLGITEAEAKLLLS